MKAPKKNIDDMTLTELEEHNAELRARLAELLAQRSEQQPDPTIEDAPQYTISEKQRRALARFDDMTDSDQVDVLREMWG